MNFSCKLCSHCCRHDPGNVFLSLSDLRLLCDHFSCSKKDFISSYCRCVPHFDGSLVLSLQEKSNFDCIFWEKGCTVYDARPVQCRTYPFWTGILKDEASWYFEGTCCPGILAKTDTTAKSFISYEKILASLEEYKNNEPLRFDATEF